MTAACACCGRFVGPALTCPYCDAPLPGRRRLVALRVGALLAAVVGLAALHAVAVATPLPLLRAGEAGPGLNYARGRIEGTVARPPSVRQTRAGHPYALFSLRDGTGTLTVIQPLTGAHVAPPAAGAVFRAAGHLEVRAGHRPLFRADP
jgi:hypothetical protein